MSLIVIVLIRQDGWTYFLFATLIANHADQIRATEFQIVFLTKLVKLAQVNASHGVSPSVMWPTETSERHSTTMLSESSGNSLSIDRSATAQPRRISLQPGSKTRSSITRFWGGHFTVVFWDDPANV